MNSGLTELNTSTGLVEKDDQEDATPQGDDAMDGEESAPIVGIDLGTSTSAIAALALGNPYLIPDSEGDDIVPSVVQVALGNEILVGARAKATAVTYHDRTILEVKRLMGQSETIKAGPRTFTPEEVSAFILTHLKESAERHLGQEIRDIVLSVPARFENEAREATRRAAERAGLNVLRLINEPTAAALAYGLNHIDENQRIMVFDFGGGTLDVTVLELFEGVLDIKTSVGDDKLGGKDVDEVLINIFRDAYKEQRGKKLPAASRDRRAAQVLKEEAENYKKMLSFTEVVQVNIPNVTEEGGISLELTRDMLENQLEEMLVRAITLCNEALSRARLRWDEIDVVLPVGGSSRIPLFRRALSSLWGREIQDYENPDEAVAKGAAIAAGIEMRRLRSEAAEEERKKSLMVLDVSPHRLGVATIKQVGSGQFVEDYFSEIIAKDEKLPVHRKRDYFTAFHGAEPITVRIYEAASDSNLCRDHHIVSELPLRNLTPDSEGEPVQVDFRYTLDGTLDVSVSYLAVPTVKVEGRFTVLGGNNGTAGSTSNGTGATNAPVVVQSLEQWRESPQAEMCAPLLDQALRMEREYPDAIIILRQATEKVKLALIGGDEEQIRAQLDELTDVLFDLA
jgi:molecular chaperone DnaK